MATLPSVFSEGGQRGWLRHFSEGTDELIQNETSYEPDAMLRCVCPGDFWRFGISGNCCQGKHETPYSVLVSNMVPSEALWILPGRSLWRYRWRFLKKRSKPAVQGLLRPFVLGYNWLRPRELTRACANCEARFASREG